MRLRDVVARLSRRNLPELHQSQSMQLLLSRSAFVSSSWLSLLAWNDGLLSMSPEEVIPTREIPLSAVFHQPPKEETARFNVGDKKSFYNDNPAPFGAILRGEIPARVLAETDRLLAFVDRAPQSPTLHALVIPKRYIATVLNVTTNDIQLLYEMRDLGQQLVERYQCGAKEDHRMVFHVPPYNSVDHLHLHVLCNADLSRKGRMKYYYDTRWCISMDSFLKQLVAASNQRPDMEPCRR
jgi:diadenosine tetraphosphate (Ap4A) HIT family hydrolase